MTVIAAIPKQAFHSTSITGGLGCLILSRFRRERLFLALAWDRHR
jgi:hypothetical protein